MRPEKLMLRKQGTYSLMFFWGLLLCLFLGQVGVSQRVRVAQLGAIPQVATCESLQCSLNESASCQDELAEHIHDYCEEHQDCTCPLSMSEHEPASNHDQRSTDQEDRSKDSEKDKEGDESLQIASDLSSLKLHYVPNSFLHIRVHTETTHSEGVWNAPFVPPRV